MCVEIYTSLQCGLKKTSTLIAYLNKTLRLSIKDIPSPNSIKNWVLKAGYSLYEESSESFKTEDYAEIIDESMMIGSEKLLLTLGIKSNKKDDIPMTKRDVEILDISIRSSWNSENIAKVLTKIEDKVGKKPAYIISDNVATICKATRNNNSKHIRDVGHTLALLAERKYKNDPEFKSFTKEVAAVAFRENMKTTGYLLPPKQRTIARFMNLSSLVHWSQRMLKIFSNLSDEEQKVFGFLKNHEPIINELTEVIRVHNQLLSTLKSKGLSFKNILDCEEYITPLFETPYLRVRQLANSIMSYLLEDFLKLENADCVWHCSSDIIESIFGTYKSRKSKNKLNGVTSLVLMLPILTKMNQENGKTNINFKKKLECVFLKEIKQWQEANLTENLTLKRRSKLKVA